MRSKSKLIKAYNKGRVEEVSEELLQYGKITRTKEWRQNTDRFLNMHAVYVVAHHGHIWNIEKKNGNVEIIRAKAV
jgi:hypothetical protein